MSISDLRQTAKQMYALQHEMITDNYIDIWDMEICFDIIVFERSTVTALYSVLVDFLQFSSIAIVV